MNFKPILFSTPMVQAILEGKKTQTRRLRNLAEINKAPDAFEFVSFSKDYGHANFRRIKGKGSPFVSINNPYGKPGDVLWVREAFGYSNSGNEFPIEHFYKASDPKFNGMDGWKPSIHMPKSACRLFLEVANIKLERLQDITESDAIAEGVGFGFQMNAGWPDYTRIKNGICELTQDTAEMSFASLWESINGKWPWLENPWVWAVEFKQIDRPENFK